MARNFDPANPDYIDFGNPSHLDIAGDKLTITIWAKRESNNDEMKLFAKWSDSPAAFSYLLSKTASNKALFAIFNGSTIITTGTTTLNVNEWYHIAGVYDGSEIRIYVNGMEEDSTATTGNITSTTAPVRIGVGSGATSEQPFDGDLGHASVRNVAFSADEVAAEAVGINPFQNRHNSLPFYVPLNGQSPEPNIGLGGGTGTVNGTIVIDEPPIPNSIKAP